jgi:aminopeptidase N
MLFRHLLIAFSVSVFLGLSAARGQELPSRPVDTPNAKVHYAPDHLYDLIHVALDLDVDYSHLAFRGVVVNTLTPLREGLTSVAFHCGENLRVESCEVVGQKATLTRDGETLTVTAPSPLIRGRSIPITIRYSSTSRESRGFFWIRSSAPTSPRVGFYTEGEPDKNRSWVPTWDYPNDFVTSETRVTVPAAWYVIGNGTLRSNRLNPGGKTRTFHWVMDRPHATYLLSLAAGIFDIKTAEWRGIPLMYVVPKGKADLIAETFSRTPDVLSFFSDTLGVKFPWPKYAQTAVYDYRSGQENVSATTLSEDSLVSKRSGFHLSDGTVAHELSHQWFGDLVTCKDWGQLWLNEGFAVFFTALYFEHSRGKATYEQNVQGIMEEYFAESERYKRPLATHLYADPKAMFDRHTYAKGAAVLHTMRRMLGDTAFFAGLRHYLTKYRCQPVDSHDLCTAMTEATGINLEPFFDQWVYKPGHPVLDYTWTWAGTKHEAVLTVKQLQDTKDGTPLYDLDMTVGLFSNKAIRREKVRIHQAEQEIRLSVADKPDAVLVDPDHDFLCQIPNLHWTAEELPILLHQAPNAVDREEAMRRLLARTPSDATLQMVTEALRADASPFPVFSLTKLGELRRVALRPFFREQMRHPNMERRTQSIYALSQLPSDGTDIQILQGLVNDREPYAVVNAAVSTLANWDAAHNRDVFEKAKGMAGQNLSLRLAAYDALAKADKIEGKENPNVDPKVADRLLKFLSDVADGNTASPRMTSGLRDFLIPGFSRGTARLLKDLKDFLFLGREDVEMDLRGAHITRIYYYKVVTGQGALYYIFRLTPEGQVGDIDIYPG